MFLQIVCQHVIPWSYNILVIKRGKFYNYLWVPKIKLTRVIKMTDHIVFLKPVIFIFILFFILISIISVKKDVHWKKMVYNIILTSNIGC